MRPPKGRRQNHRVLSVSQGSGVAMPKGLSAPVSNRKKSRWGAGSRVMQGHLAAAAVAAQNGHGTQDVTALAPLPDVEVWRGLLPGFRWWLGWPG